MEGVNFLVCFLFLIIRYRDQVKAKYKAILLILFSLAAAAVAALFISTHEIAVLEPKGMIGAKERDLIYTASLLMLIVVVPVFVFTAIFAWRYRESNEAAKHEPDWEHNNIAECCWWGVPIVIIFILAVITWKSTHDLNPFRPIENGRRPITIQAVALQWKWLFLYPEHGIATINYIEFPEKTPINFQITADAPMNSFWIPELGGQIYAMPAMVSKLHLIAEKEGTFRGLSANFSGTGFAGMHFTAKARSQSDFEQWVQKVKGATEAMHFKTFLPLVTPSSYVPPTFYVLTQTDLFDRIVGQYSPPSES